MDEDKARRIIRIGHRGAAGHAPENTLAAFRTGISLGADFVEMDVQRTRDGHLVVMHDARVNRTTNGRGAVSAMTWEELQALDAGGGERIPSVEAALAAADGQAGVMLEVKMPGIAGELYRAVQAAGFSGPVVYASFLMAEIVEIHRLDPRAKTLALMERISRSAAALALAAGATLAGPNYHFVTAKGIRALHDAGLQVWVFTVNQPRQIARALSLGADGVISDYPERVPKQRPE
jgi:glycerophosphoryl diester phosphodiesterase